MSQTTLSNSGILTIDAGNSLYIDGNLINQTANANTVLKGEILLTGNFVNNVSAGNLFDSSSNGVFRFIGTSLQTISGSADKTANFIKFPTIEVRNPASIHLDYRMGITVNTLDLTKGKLVLKSASLSSSTTENAHLIVTNSINYNRSAGSNAEMGVVEVELALGSSRATRFTGFSSPYQRMYADYMFFNFLMRPTNAGLFGDTGKTITDIHHTLNAGEGYLLGQDVYVMDYIPAYPEALYSERFQDSLVMNRYNFELKSPSIATHLTVADRYTGESLNISDVTVPLSGAGFHYLGNPFTSPLDLSALLNDAATADEWGVSRGESNGDLYTGFWILNNAVAGNINSQTLRFDIGVNYLVAQRVGGTVSLDPSMQNTLIAPMQLFVVYKFSGGTTQFTIPAAKRTHGNINYLKSGIANWVEDELLIQVEDQDTKAFDRICVVFRPDADFDASHRYDAFKIMNHSRLVSQLFTEASGGEILTTNVIPHHAKRMPMKLIPASEPKTVRLTAHRLHSLNTPEGVWLEDLLQPQQEWINLAENPVYEFETNPEDNSERFVLHFAAADITTPKNPMQYIPKLRTSYQNKLLRIAGLTDLDKGADLYISDTQGRVLYHEVLLDVGTSFEKILDLPLGVYIVKIQGNRQFVEKILATCVH